jgi:hypothetical protein
MGNDVIIREGLLRGMLMSTCMSQVVQLKRDPNGEEKRIRATLRKNMLRREDTSEMATQITLLSQENSRYRQIFDSVS